MAVHEVEHDPMKSFQIRLEVSAKSNPCTTALAESNQMPPICICKSSRVNNLRDVPSRVVPNADPEPPLAS